MDNAYGFCNSQGVAALRSLASEERMAKRKGSTDPTRRGVLIAGTAAAGSVGAAFTSAGARQRAHRAFEVGDQGGMP